MSHENVGLMNYSRELQLKLKNNSSWCAEQNANEPPFPAIIWS